MKMKKKFSRILGVGLTLALLTSLMVAALPVSGAPLLFTDEKDIPKVDDKFLAPYAGADIVDMAANGDTIYAAVPAGTTGNVTYKSTDGGASWSDLSSTVAYPSQGVKLVAVAPDNADVVAICADNNTIYYSTNGGSSWKNLGIPGTTATVYDIDVSPDADGYNYVAAGAAISNVAELYTLKLAMAETWQARSGSTTATGNFTPGQKLIKAVKFSPNFETDKIITCISANATSGATTAYFQAFRYESGAYSWNGGIAYFESWQTANTQDGTAIGALDIAVTLSGGLAAASIELVPTFDGTDEGERIAFISVAGTTTGGGVCRITDNYVKKFETWSAGDEGAIGSIAYNDAGILLAGSYTANQVYVCLDSMASSPKFERVNSLKQPSGVEKTVVGWASDVAVAGTTGDESAFAVSTDDGYSFNDISLIDTALTTVDDIALSADGTKVYLTSHDATNDTSIWFKDGTWSRVLSLPGLGATTASFLVRLAPEDDSVVYISSKGSQNVWVSKNSGTASWKNVPCYKLSSTTGIQDFVVESADVVYAIDKTNCSKTINAGASWKTGESLELDGHGFMVTLSPNGDVLVGSDNGYVSFSEDGGASFTKILDLIESGANVYVVADEDYAENDIIYVAAGDEVERGMTNRTYTYKGREHGDLSSTVTGIARYGSAIYVMTYDGTDSYLWRALGLQTAATAGQAGWGYYKGSGKAFNIEPQALKVSPEKAADEVMFSAINTADNLWYTYIDPISTTGPTLHSPADSFSVTVNPETGKAYNVTFSWERYHSNDIDACKLQIATAADFSGLVYEQEFSGITSDVITQVVGPTGATTTKTETVTVPAYTTTTNTSATVNQTTWFPATTTSQLVTTYRTVDFNPGTTYYWRVKSSGTAFGTMASPWSAVRSFAVEDVAAPPFSVLAPVSGSTDASLTPTLVWSDYPGAIGYVLMFSMDPTFAVIEFSRSIVSPFYQIEEALDYSTTYYFKVRGVTGVAADPANPPPGSAWVSSAFTTKDAPPPAAEPTVIVTEKPAPPPEIVRVEVPVPQPQPIPSALLWAIIGIGAILVIALIVLIVRTRRVV
ncbi:WD40/YVTN/BNR-like repeat-containing protein [Chloroflexota bacterium]